MNCDCYKNTAERIFDMKIYDKRNIIEVSEPDVIYTFGTNAGKTGTLSYEEFDVELEGLKKPKKVKVSHTFCPFCGTATGKIDPNIKDNNPLDFDKNESKI